MLQVRQTAKFARKTPTVESQHQAARIATSMTQTQSGHPLEARYVLPRPTAARMTTWQFTQPVAATGKEFGPGL